MKGLWDEEAYGCADFAAAGATVDMLAVKWVGASLEHASEL